MAASSMVVLFSAAVAIALSNRWPEHRVAGVVCGSGDAADGPLDVG